MDRTGAAAAAAKAAAKEKQKNKRVRRSFLQFMVEQGEDTFLSLNAGLFPVGDHSLNISAYERVTNQRLN